MRVYPESQWVYAGNDAVLQCRDEGDLRAEVEWMRNGGRELNKKRSVQGPRGRLTLFELTAEEGGLYSCYVKGKESIHVESLISVRRRK